MPKRVCYVVDVERGKCHSEWEWKRDGKTHGEQAEKDKKGLIRSK